MPIFRSQGLPAATLASTLLLSFLLPPPAMANVEKIMQICSGKLCPFFLPQLPAPSGWAVDKPTSDANRVVVLIPQGSDFGSAEAVIYAKAFYNFEKASIRSRADISNRQWLTVAKNAKIDRIADVARIKGGAAFEVYQYHNPENSQQRAEMVAFGEDTDKDGNLFGVQVVLTAGDEAALANNKEAFISMLKNY